MNKREALAAIKIMQAFVNGQEIQCNNTYINTSWEDTSDPYFDFRNTLYRIKPKQDYCRVALCGVPGKTKTIPINFIGDLQIAAAEKKAADKEGQEAVDNIKESVDREKKYTEAELQEELRKERASSRAAKKEKVHKAIDETMAKT